MLYVLGALTGVYTLLVTPAIAHRLPFEVRGRRQFGDGAESEKRLLAGELRECQHGFTSYLRARAQDYAAEHGTPLPEDRQPDWDASFAGDQSWEDKTVAQFKYVYRERLYNLLDRAHTAGIGVEDEMNALRFASSVNDIWALQKRLYRIETDLRGGPF